MGVIETRLIAARDMLAKRNGWCRHSFRKLVTTKHGDVYQRCALGAIRAVCGVSEYHEGSRPVGRAVKFMVDCLKIDNLVAWNDSHKKDEVLAGFDVAIKKARQLRR